MTPAAPFVQPNRRGASGGREGGRTVADGCPGFSGAAAFSLTTYAYKSTDDCPNPPPPQ
jgi:hypothetical protein